MRRHVAVLALTAAWAIAAGGNASAAGLSAERAYELVSPAQKFGYPLGGNTAPTVEMSASRDGDRVSYIGLFPIPGAESGSSAGLLATRGDGGWSTSSWLPAPGPNQILLGAPNSDAVLRGQTRDQTAAVYYDNTTEPYGSLWIRRGDGSKQMIAPASIDVVTGTSGSYPGQPWFEGISDDGRHVVFADTDALVDTVDPTSSPDCTTFVPGPGPVDACEILYEWVDDGTNEGAGTLRVISRIEGASSALGGSGRHAALFDPGTYGLRHAISADGSRIFFQAPAVVNAFGGIPQGGGSLYVQEPGPNGEPTTRLLSAPAPGHTPAVAPAHIQYLDAAADGHVAFFWADGDLTVDAPPEGGIYRYDLEAGELAFLATAPVMGDGRTPGALASEDGSHLYYEDGGNLSLIVGDEQRVITQAEVQSGFVPPGEKTGLATNPGMHADLCPSANVSADGRFFVFSGRLGPVQLQVYRYDAVTGALDQISTSPMDPGGFHAGFGAAGACDPFANRRQFETRVMSDDGRYVFFDTAAQLVPEDNNGIFDAYEWHDGHVSLLSSGTSPSNSLFTGTDVAGKNAFFLTRDALLPQDGDDVYDLYDARVGGGFPLDQQRPCTGENCQGPPSGAPAVGQPGSTVLSESGNVRTPKAARVRLVKPSRRALARLARTGRITITVRTTRRGTIVARLLARTGKRFVAVDVARRSQERAGTTRLRLALSSGARAALSRKGSLRVRIVVKSSGARATQASFLLRASSSTSRGGR